MAVAQDGDDPVPTPLQVKWCPKDKPLCDPLGVGPRKGPVGTGGAAGSVAPEFVDAGGGGFVSGSGGAAAITQPDYFRQFDAESAGSRFMRGQPAGKGFPSLLWQGPK